MKRRSEMLAHGLEQVIVSEPAIANNRDRDIGIMMGDLYNHPGRLLKLCVEGGDFTGDIHAL